MINNFDLLHCNINNFKFIIGSEKVCLHYDSLTVTNLMAVIIQLNHLQSTINTILCIFFSAEGTQTSNRMEDMIKQIRKIIKKSFEPKMLVEVSDNLGMFKNLKTDNSEQDDAEVADAEDDEAIIGIEDMIHTILIIIKGLFAERKFNFGKAKQENEIINLKYHLIEGKKEKDMEEATAEKIVDVEVDATATATNVTHKTAQEDDIVKISYKTTYLQSNFNNLYHKIGTLKPTGSSTKCYEVIFDFFTNIEDIVNKNQIKKKKK